MTRAHILDVIIFIILLLIGLAFPYLVRDTVLDYSLAWYLILTLPTVVYLGLRGRKNWKKIAVGSLVFGLLFGSILEVFAHVTNTWVVPSTLFPFRVWGLGSMEAFIGYILMTSYIFVFYEHFFDKDRNHRISPHIWYAIIPAILVWILIIVLHYINPSRLFFTHAYLKMATVAILPLILQLLKSPKLLLKYIPLAASLFFVIFAWEIVGLTFHYWLFPGKDYLGRVSYFGQGFPIEEVIFWMLLYPATIASYYERFIDDEK